MLKYKGIFIYFCEGKKREIPRTFPGLQNKLLFQRLDFLFKTLEVKGIGFDFRGFKKTSGLRNLVQFKQLVVLNYSIWKGWWQNYLGLRTLVGLPFWGLRFG